MERQALEELIAEGLSQREIGVRIGRSQASVKYWLDKHGLRTRYVRPPSLREAMTEKYLERHCPHHGMTRFVFVKSAEKYICVRCRYEGIKRRRLKVKGILVAEHGGCCQVCEYSKSLRALHFHHLEPDKKEFHIARNATVVAIARLRLEAAKCVLLCSNCHTEAEEGLITLEQLLPLAGPLSARASSTVG